MTGAAWFVLASCFVGCGPRPDARSQAAPQPTTPALELTTSGLQGANLQAPVTLASLPVQVPGYTARDSVEYFESGPDTPVSVWCLVRRGGACDLVLFHDAGTITRIRVLDPEVHAPGAVGVGLAYHAVAGSLERCQVTDGNERGMTCAVRGSTNIEAWFALGDDVTVVDERPTPEILKVAKVTHLWWWLPGT